MKANPILKNETAQKKSKKENAPDKSANHFFSIRVEKQGVKNTVQFFSNQSAKGGHKIIYHEQI